VVYAKEKFSKSAKQISLPNLIISVSFLSGIVMSMICAILTIAVYIYVKKLRNTLGKCVISCLFSLAIVHFLEILEWFGLLEIYSFLGMWWISDQISNILLYFFICRKRDVHLRDRLHDMASRYWLSLVANLKPPQARWAQTSISSLQFFCVDYDCWICRIVFFKGTCCLALCNW